MPAKNPPTGTPFPKTSQPALRALNGAGYTHLEQLAGSKASDILKLHGMGHKAMHILKEALAEKGLSFVHDVTES